ncbi:hypothetical protein SAMN05660284_02582 [Formivibrio citricus]|uniref:histidine kinase n=1 Tax=Formivibrio citricus TaxID=83765 RepID=A0A1I5D722_9NEIS|nr:PAS domain-containing protein [Formivibrio citricus]SFN94631.1 hypothetical protein SAMN05660284_02582 [Formivibrio citricus]
MTSARDRFILFCVVAYAVLASLWIFMSDRLLAMFADVQSIVWLSTAKGVFFVAASAATFFLALRAVPTGDGDGDSARLLEALSSGVSPGRLPVWLSYSFAVLMTLAMLALRESISAGIGGRSLLILFMFPITFSALLGGLGPGLVSTALAGLGVAYFSLPPRGSFHIAASYDLLQWSFLLINGLAVSILSAMLRRSLARAETNRRLLDVVISGTEDAVFVKDARGRYLLVNDAAAGFVGKTQSEIIGHDDRALFPAESAAYLRAMDQTVMSAGHTQTHEEQLTTQDGKSLVFLVTKGPVFDEKGQVAGLFGISREITARKQAEDEIRRLNAELEQRVAERTAELNAANLELEDLAYALAHNLRAPLRAIDGFAHLLTEEHAGQLDAEARSCLMQITLANRNMGALIDGILALLRCSRGELLRQSVDISQLAEKRFDDLARIEPQRQIDAEIAPGLAVAGDRTMLEIAMNQLVDNAWKFTRGREHAVIRVYRGEVDGHPAICVADNGAGFDMAHVERLYQPFYRLHRQDEFPGIGIGLATVRRIIHRHGGNIRAEGVPGSGAIFCFSLPSVMSGVEDSHEEKKHPAG